MPWDLQLRYSDVRGYTLVVGGVSISTDVHLVTVIVDVETAEGIPGDLADLVQWF